MENNTILKNDKETVKYRRNLNTLVVFGTGVAVFGFWGIIKLIAQILLGFQIVDPELLDGLNPAGIVFVMFFVAAVLAIDVILRLYAGLRARREGYGKKTGAGHRIVLILLIISSVITVTFVIISIITASGDLEENITGLFMELSSLVITLEVFMASASVRKYRKRTGTEVK